MEIIMALLIVFGVLIFTGLIVFLVLFLTFGTVIAAIVGLAITTVFGIIFDFSHPGIMLASVILFGVVAYLIDKRKRSKLTIR